MADRTVSVNLVLDAKQYVQGMDQMVRKTQDSTRSVEQQLQAQSQAYQTVGVAATAVGVAALAGVAMAVSAATEFDAAMSGVQAATHETEANMELLGDAALDAGQRTVYSATEAAAAIENLSRAGVSTADILGGALDGALDLAASDGLAVADAAELAASAMTQFGLAGEDVSHVADLLAAGAGKAQGGVADLGAALNQSGFVAAQMGLSIDETVGSLTAFASAGLIGSDAGTSFRAMLLRLANPTQESARIMDDLGLSFYDAQGQFIGMEGVAGQLASQLSNLTDEQRNAALAQIFGQDAIRSASILYTQGAEGIRDWTDAVDEQGYAAETAAIRLDNLKGDLEALGGAWETFMISLGAGADGPLRLGVQALTNVVEALGDMDPVMQAVVLGALGLVGVVGLAGGAAMIALPQVVAFRGALATLGVSTGVASGAVGKLTGFLGSPWTVAIAGAAAGVLLLNDYLESTRATTAEVEAMLRGGASAARLFEEATPDNLSRFDFDTTSAAEFEDYINRIAIRSENMFAAFDTGNFALDNSGFAAALADVDERLGAMDFENASRGFRTLVEDMDLSEEAAARLIDAMPGVREALLAQAEALEMDVTAADGSIDSQALLAVAYAESGDAADLAAEGADEVAVAYTTTAEAATELVEANQAVIDQFFAAQDAMIGYEQSVDDLQEAIDEGLAPALDAAGTNFDLSTQAGRDAAAQLGDVVEGSNAATAALIEQGASAEELAAHQDAARAEIERLAGQMDATGAVAETYTGQLLDIPAAVATAVEFNPTPATTAAEFYMAVLGRIPDGVNTEVLLSTFQAQANVDGFINTNDGRRIRINVETGQIGVGSSGALGVNIARASGGLIPGWSPGVDDRLGYAPGTGLIGLGGGEYVVRTLMADKYLPILEQINAGTYPGYASGGRVGSSYDSSVHYGSTSYQVVLHADRESAAPLLERAMTQFRHWDRGGRYGRR